MAITDSNLNYRINETFKEKIINNLYGLQAYDLHAKIAKHVITTQDLLNSINVQLIQPKTLSYQKAQILY